MTNYFSDNQDLTLQFSRLALEEVVELLESGYSPSSNQGAGTAPESYQEAVEVYRDSLELLGDIAANFIAPRSAEIDASGSRLSDGKVVYSRATDEARQRLADSGFMGITLPRNFGGANFPATIYMMMIEMVSRADASLMTLFGYQDVGDLIAHFGSERQASRYLPGLASGELIGAIVLSEPGAGSDLQAIRLRATEGEKGNWTLDGVKHFISNGGADVLMVLARSEENIANIFGLSLFICPKSDQVSVTRVEEKMGLHGSPTCELLFENAPAELLGKRKVGLTRYILESLNQARFSVAAQALGIAEGAYQQAEVYASQRVQFGQEIVNFPAVRELLDNMELSLQSSRAMLYESTKWLDLKQQLSAVVEHDGSDESDRDDAREKLRQASKYVNLLSPLVKYVVTEAANVVCYNAQQVFGGLGYMRETGIERLVRDVRITTIYEGTSQIQVAASLKLILSDTMKPLFDEWQDLTYPDSLHGIVTQTKENRQIFDDILTFLQVRDNQRLYDAVARDLADIYSQIFGSFVLLRSAAGQEKRVMLAKQYVIDANAFATAKLIGLRKGRYDKWLV